MNSTQIAQDSLSTSWSIKEILEKELEFKWSILKRLCARIESSRNYKLCLKGKIPYYKFPV